MPTPNLSQILTTTMRNQPKSLADNVTDNNALLMKLSERGRIKTFDGGATITQSLNYADNPSYRRYSGWETVSTATDDVFSAAEYDIKQAAVTVGMNGLEMMQNSGKERIINLLEAKVDNAIITLKNNVCADLYSAGTADGGRQIDGLNAQVASAPATGTVGGINRANWTFWRNQVYDFSDLSITASATTITAAMNAIYLACSRGTDYPDLFIADNNYFNFYWSSLQSIQRITDTKLGQAGFTNLKYMNADVVFDGGIGGNCPANTMFALNTNYIHFRPHMDRNFVVLDNDRFSTNQDGFVKLIGFGGNLTMSNAFLQGRIQA